QLFAPTYVIDGRGGAGASEGSDFAGQRLRGTSFTATSDASVTPVQSTGCAVNAVPRTMTAAIGPRLRVQPYSGRSRRIQSDTRKIVTGTATARPAPAA